MGDNHNYEQFTYNTIARSVIDMNMEFVQQHSGKINIIFHEEKSNPKTIETPNLIHHEQLQYIDEQFRSEEHTSELQSRGHLVCRLLLEEKRNDADAQTAGGTCMQVRWSA